MVGLLKHPITLRAVWLWNVKNVDTFGLKHARRSGDRMNAQRTSNGTEGIDVYQSNRFVLLRILRGHITISYGFIL